jgi:hypothetical protein
MLGKKMIAFGFEFDFDQIKKMVYGCFRADVVFVITEIIENL